MTVGTVRYPLGALLAAAHARFVAECESRLATDGFPDLSISHGTNVLRHLTPDAPARVSELVRLSTVTKQAISQQVSYLVSRGYLTVERDERDRRGKVVALTARGAESQRAIRAAFAGVHDAWRTAYGEERMRVLTAALIEIAETAEAPDSTVSPRDARREGSLTAAIP